VKPLPLAWQAPCRGRRDLGYCSAGPSGWLPPEGRDGLHNAVQQIVQSSRRPVVHRLVMVPQVACESMHAREG